jgi:hypothetical protein
MGSSRALREAKIAEFARLNGVPTYTPLAAVTRRILAVFYRAHLVSEEISGGMDLLEYMSVDPPPLERGRIFEKTGRAVRAMHDLGCYHADLHLKNLYVRNAKAPDPEVFILDWDKSKAYSSLSRRLRFQNLARLDRSGAKLRRKGVSVTARDRLRFLKGYLGGDRMFRPGEFQRAEFIWKLHALGWRIGDLFS